MQRSIFLAGVTLASALALLPALALGGTPDIAPHQIAVVNAGLELDFSGGMDAGSAEALRKVLRDNPGVQVLHLNSPGGLVNEARQIYDLIQRRQLITTTDRYCLSACALAFLAGRQRYLAPGAHLGFHQEYNDDATQAQVESAEQLDKQTMQSLGVPANFIDKAFSTPRDQIWLPSVSELEDAHVIDGVSSDYVLDAGPAAAGTGGKAMSSAHSGGSDTPAVEETPDGIVIYRGPGQ